ncbi:MAG: hypothetical protein ISS36_02440 [Candidatus Aenigmarchaeota archaeon]|nr:hypothetical protein [Candidatus Aenigmarchaeota archaeon]
MEKDIGNKLKDGWVKVVAMIEVLAVTEETAKSSLEKHIEGLEKEKNVLLYRKDFQKIEKVEKPIQGIEVAYSNLVEVEFVAKNLDTLVKIVMNYAPSSIEIIEPEKLKIDMGEAQGVLNSIAEMVHKFAAAGLGGVIINT